MTLTDNNKMTLTEHECDVQCSKLIKEYIAHRYDEAIADKLIIHFGFVWACMLLLVVYYYFKHKDNFIKRLNNRHNRMVWNLLKYKAEDIYYKCVEFCAVLVQLMRN